MGNRDWIYLGVFLDDDSRKKLVELAKTVMGDTWRIYCHHMTIAFNNRRKEALDMYEYYQPEFGKEIDLVATHIGISEDAIAVKIDYNDKSLNKFPHITLATPYDGKPVNSNYIHNWKPLEEPISLHGTINCFAIK